jgi:hypothetical protein
MSFGGGLFQLVIYGAQDILEYEYENEYENEINRHPTHVAGNRRGSTKRPHEKIYPKPSNMSYGKTIQSTRNDYVLTQDEQEHMLWRLAKERNKILKLDDSNECCITYEIIQKDELYVKCPQCKNIMSFEAANKWIEMKNNCPICRFNIYDIDNISFRNQ